MSGESEALMSNNMRTLLRSIAFITGGVFSLILCYTISEFWLFTYVYDGADELNDALGFGWILFISIYFAGGITGYCIVIQKLKNKNLATRLGLAITVGAVIGNVIMAALYLGLYLIALIAR